MNAPTTIPSPEQFLALPSDPDEEEAEHVEPLESIAASLLSIASTIAANLAVSPESAPGSAPETEDACEAHAKALHACQESLDELRRTNSEQAAQLQQVLAICKPSVGKLANRIREALQPAAEPAQQPASEQTAEVHAEPECPADDAPAEEWQAYARSLGYAGPDVDKMNRSQIRTMLGIAQPVTQPVAQAATEG